MGLAALGPPYTYTSNYDRPAALHIRQVIAAAGADQCIERRGQRRVVRARFGVDAANAVAQRNLPEQLAVGQRRGSSPGAGS